MTESANERFLQWKRTLQGSNLVEILNTMEEIVQKGDWHALGLLTIAGQNVEGYAKRLPIKTSHGKFNFDQFRAHCIERLQERLDAAPIRPSLPHGQSPARVFISYNHRDREAANALALEIAKAKADVFLDHWEMSPHDELLPRIERELHESDAVVILLSRASVASLWVTRELDTVIARQRAGGHVQILPVLLEDCDLPEVIRSRPYFDFRKAERRAVVAQAILNQVFGHKPFSLRVMDFLDKPPASPYTQQAQSNGHRLLQELARYEAMEIVNNQQWLLWELFHELLTKYTCTLKLGRQRSADEPSEPYEFILVDRWNRTMSSFLLTEEELVRGLWQGEVDLLKSQTIRSDGLRYLGSLGRPSLNSEFNPNVGENTADASARPAMEPILRSLMQSCKVFDEGSQQSFLFDYQRLVMPADWHRVRVVVGSTRSSETLAYSTLTFNVDDQTPGTCAVFEVVDPFFASLKYTQAYQSQLHALWEGDVDLMSTHMETLLGLA